MPLSEWLALGIVSGFVLVIVGGGWFVQTEPGKRLMDWIGDRL